MKSILSVVVFALTATCASAGPLDGIWMETTGGSNKFHLIRQGSNNVVVGVKLLLTNIQADNPGTVDSIGIGTATSNADTTLTLTYDTVTKTKVLILTLIDSNNISVVIRSCTPKVAGACDNQILNTPVSVVRVL